MLSRVKDAMRCELVTISHDATVRDAERKLRDAAIGSIFVVAGGAIVGVLTEQNIVRNVYATGRDDATTTVDSVMSAPVISIAIEASVREAITDDGGAGDSSSRRDER